MGPIPGLTQWVQVSSTALSCGVGRRQGLDLKLLWLWCRLAATAPIRPLAWEYPYASVVALKRLKDKKRKKDHGIMVLPLTICMIWFKVNSSVKWIK